MRNIEMTQENLAEKQNTNQREQLFPMLDAVISIIDEGVIISDKNGDVLFHNPAAMKLLNLNVDTNIKKIQHLGELNLQRELFTQVDDMENFERQHTPMGQFYIFETQVQTAKSTRYLEINTGIVKCQINNKNVRLILLRDKTEQRVLEAAYKNKYTDIIYADPNMLEIIEKIHTVANSPASIFLKGGAGCGKTLLARFIHQLSHRNHSSFITFDCSAVPESLHESELFSTDGKFQQAENGTLFIKNVDLLPLQIQSKLLDVIQNQSNTDTQLRLLSSSHKNLRKLVDQGLFRSDLYYRLAVIPLVIPNLSDRPGDIPKLVDHFCKRFATRGYAKDASIDAEALKVLMDYSWPGNVRELENVIEHGLICAVEGRIVADSLPNYLISKISTNSNIKSNNKGRIQSHEIQSALSICNGSKSNAAKLLGINRSTLWRRMQKLSSS